MRTKRIASFAIAAAVLLLCCATAVHAFAAPPGWTVNQLTSGDNPNQDPWVSGDRVAWYGSDGANLQIYTWKTGDSAPTTLTSAPRDSEGPAVSGDRVVWDTEVDPNITQICTWKVGDSLPTTLTTGAHLHLVPQVSGDRVVWQGYTDATHSQTYTWEVGDSSATTLTTSASSSSNQAVSGDRVAWEGWDGAHDQIYTWKSGDFAPSMLTSVTGNGQAPEVSGDRAVWTGSNGSQSQIYTWAAGDTSATLLASPVLNNSNPQVSGDRVVWQGYDGVAWHIYTWKSGDISVTQLTYGTYNDDQNPQVSGDRIVWYGSGRVFTQKIGESEATTLSASVGGLTWPEVSGDHVVWAGKDGSNWQVFDASASSPFVTFPDPGLDAAIRAMIGKPMPEEIRSSDLATITGLQLEGYGIKRLDGLENAANITWLDLWGNEITTITPLGSLTHLSSAVLPYNEISDLTPLASLNASLTNLDVSYNRITDPTPLEGLTNLSYLGLNGNQISDISSLHGVPFGYVDIRYNWLDLEPGSAASQTIDWWLAHGTGVTWLPQNVGAITGTVRELGGGVLPGATVTLSSGPTGGTTADGTYSIPSVAAGEQTATVSAPYFYSSSSTFSVHESTTTVDAVLTPQRLSLTMKRSPSSSALSYKRKKGVAKFTLAVTLSDPRGAVAGVAVWLQKSSNGKKWSNLYRLATSTSGKASKAFSAKKKGTTYYRWSAAATAFDGAGLTPKQKVVVK
ncbi:MAG: leucine-rich repeat domain-containing protein [Coriobacteriia bacterium]|nr:leucine-rich repeat domain-containing protein [Coriobacteriia bacterium]